MGFDYFDYHTVLQWNLCCRACSGATWVSTLEPIGSIPQTEFVAEHVPGQRDGTRWVPNSQPPSAPRARGQRGNPAGKNQSNRPEPRQEMID